MNTAVGLLMAAMQLLALVQANPSLPEDFKERATNTANYAIAYAEAQIAASTTPITPVQNAPIVGAIIPVQPTVATPVDKSDLIITEKFLAPSTVYPFGQFIFKVSVLDSNGAYTKSPITFNGETLTPDTITTAKLKDWNVSFFYTPTSDEPTTLTFSGGGKEKSVTIYGSTN